MSEHPVYQAKSPLKLLTGVFTSTSSQDCGVFKLPVKAEQLISSSFSLVLSSVTSHHSYRCSAHISPEQRSDEPESVKTPAGAFSSALFQRDSHQEQNESNAGVDQSLRFDQMFLCSCYTTSSAVTV